MSVDNSRGLLAKLADMGVRCRLVVIGGGHATPVLARYEPAIDMCVPVPDLTPPMIEALEAIDGFVRLDRDAGKAVERVRH